MTTEIFTIEVMRIISNILGVFVCIMGLIAIVGVGLVIQHMKNDERIPQHRDEERTLRFMNRD